MELVTVIIVVSIILFILLAVGLPLYFDYCWDKKRKQMNKENKEWLEQELSNPKYRILFITQGNLVYFTAKFEPTVTWSHKRTSKEVAKSYLENVPNQGYIENEEGLYIPYHEIIAMEITE